MSDGDGENGRDARDSEDTTLSGPLAPPLRLESAPSESSEEEDATHVLPVEALSPEREAEPEKRSVDDAGNEPPPQSRTAIAPSASLPPMLLERIEPSLGRGERIRLDAAHWRVRIGRAEHNDLRLYTASASRDHAEIVGNESGDWVLTPESGRQVAIDGYDTDEPVVLEVGMNLVFGGDHLRCVTEGLGRDHMAAVTEAEGFGETTGRKGGVLYWWIIGAIAIVGLGLIAWAWFAG